tara:strand:+ start:197 stop:1756 length:1560 start_codon:yes stop_codon:yes gene_type:complete
MCGIFFISNTEGYSQDEVLDAFQKIKHRGPDDSQFLFKENSFSLGFHRLSINDTSNFGNQPFSLDESLLICNGEIYNHKKLSTPYKNELQSSSDCEPLLHMFNSNIEVNDICNSIDGVFAFCIVKTDGSFVVARDRIGIRPLYWTRLLNGGYAFASEAKALIQLNPIHITHFPPGYYFEDGHLWKYDNASRVTSLFSLNILASILESSVSKRLMSDRPVGFLLSGGLDSSLIASIGAKYNEDPIKTFSIGMSVDAPDLLYARKVSEFIGSEHTEIIYSFEEGCNAIDEVIRILESFDTTTVRASVPMWILSKYISDKTDIKVILSGEGADELFGGYIYTRNAPNADSFNRECNRLVEEVHMFDALRADRCTAAHGLELRVPFFDKELVNYVKCIGTNLKMSSEKKIEKEILRKSFDFNMLPKDVLWRQKNAFSDAVGYNWVDNLREYTKTLVTDEEFKQIRNQEGICKPMTKEEAFYRKTYNVYYPPESLTSITKFWKPRWTKINDPSAALFEFHNKST